MITPWGTSYGKQAIYSCDVDGYQVVGSSVRVCLENGTWSGEEPVCNIAGKLVLGNQLQSIPGGWFQCQSVSGEWYLRSGEEPACNIAGKLVLGNQLQSIPGGWFQCQSVSGEWYLRSGEDPVCNIAGQLVFLSWGTSYGKL